MNAHYIFFDVQSALPQRGGEVNLTLGGIDLNNSGRYVKSQSVVCSGILIKVSNSHSYNLAVLLLEKIKSY